MIYFLDTSFIVNFFRHGGKWADKIALLKNKGELQISVITYAELSYGLLKANNPAREKEKVNGFLNNFGVEIAPLTTEIAEIYSQTRFSLEKKGARLDDFDLLIAASAVDCKANLVTDNIKHFQRFIGLKLYED